MYSRFVSDWASGQSSDYLGYYFKIPDAVFRECVINIFNSWGALASKGQLGIDEKQFEEKLTKENKQTQSYYRIVGRMINSIRFDIDDTSKFVDFNYQFVNSETVDGLYTPTINNLRFRESPSIEAPMIGFVEEKPYRIIEKGPEETIAGEKGQWVRMISVLGTTVGWAFDAYLRPLSEQELSYLYGRER
jgi:hypothetical protein